MLGALIRQFVVLVPFVWIFTKFFGLGMTWYAMWISEAVAFAVSFYLTKKEIKNKVL